MMKIEVNNTAIQVKLCKNSSAEAIRQLLKKRSSDHSYEGLRPYGEIRQPGNAAAKK